jgi:hypothetical protein
MTTDALGTLIHAHPELPHPVTYDAVADLAERLRADLALAETVLTALRADEIAALEARLLALRAADAPPPKLRRKQPARIVAAEPFEATTDEAQIIADATNGLPCRVPGCGRDGLMSERARQTHERRAHNYRHGEPRPEPEPEPAPAPKPTPEPALTLDPERWACACHGAFARSAKDPTRCIRCTGEYAAAQSRRAA